jgi:putative protease
MPEILAPAGSYEALQAAVRCGADAVYLGLESYGARANAKNFTMPALREALRYCRARGVFVYVTLNTLLTDAELPHFAQTVAELCDLAVDAVIVQDLGVARLIKQIAPGLRLHASTQMSVQSLGGLQALADLGFARAVLPRELSQGELKRTIAAAPIECEVFVHGALCSSLSGQCLMSAFFGGRSANRGECAQPCRLPFSRKGEPAGGCALSLKDLSLLDYLPQLAEMGVSSFKIEGRMKRPEYVAAAVTACRQAIDGGVKDDLRDSLRAVFSRSGFTDGYYTAQRAGGMEGIRSREDVLAAKTTLPLLASLFQKDSPKYAVEMSFDAKIGARARLEIKLQDSALSPVTVLSEGLVEPASGGGLSYERTAEQLKKCGGTAFFCADCRLRLDEGAHLPLSAINAMRRDALSLLEAALCRREAIPCAAAEIKLRPRNTSGGGKLCLRLRTAEQIPARLDGVTRLILPLGEELPALPERVLPAVELPRGIFGNEEKILRQLQKAATLGYKQAVVSGLDGAALARRAGMDFYAGFGSNVCNTWAIAAWRELGAVGVLLSPELQQQDAARLGDSLPRSLFAYGRLPLMLLRRLGYGTLTDRKSKDFPVDENGDYSELFACSPVYLADRRRELLFADELMLFMTDESPARCEEILEAFRRGTAPTGQYTRGLSSLKAHGA